MSDGAQSFPPAPEASSRTSVTPARLPSGTIARYSIGSLGTGGFATLPGLVLTYYLTDSLGVAALFAGLVLMVAKVWDVVIDPVIGALTDRDLARHGSRRRLMRLGALALPVLFTLTFAVPPALGPVLGGIWVLVAFMLTATAFSLFQVPYIALPAELTPSYDERTRLLSWRVVVLTFAILLFGAGGPALRRLTDDPVLSYLVMGAVAGVVIGAGMWIATSVADRAARRSAARASTHPSVLSAPTEPIRTLADQPDFPVPGAAALAADPAAALPDSTPEGAPTAGRIREQYAEGLRALRRSAPFRTLLATFALQALATGLMLAGAQYMATWVLRDEAAVELLFIALIAPALLAAPGWGVVARLVGKERAYVAASVLFAAAALAVLPALWGPGAWIYAPVAVAGIAYAGMQSLPMAMLPDVISHDETRHGPGRAGAFSGIWTAGETVGFALGATVLSLVLALTGYVVSTAAVPAADIVQPDAAVGGIVLSFSVVPAVLIAVSLAFLGRYSLRREHIDAA